MVELVKTYLLHFWDHALWWLLPGRWYRKLRVRDHCEVCHGERGGVRGNENVEEVDGQRVVMCDYCSANLALGPRFLPTRRELS